jgi:hypothetical protein
MAQIASRAQDRCEYCQMHQSLQGATFHVEHIVPRSRSGSSELSNLAWACPGCNLHKTDRVEVVDPATNLSVKLFDPRNDHWFDHFEWKGYAILGLTPIGRATVHALDLNHPRRLQVRRAEELFGLFPPMI